MLEAFRSASQLALPLTLFLTYADFVQCGLMKVRELQYEQQLQIPDRADGETPSVVPPICKLPLHERVVVLNSLFDTILQMSAALESCRVRTQVAVALGPVWQDRTAMNESEKQFSFTHATLSASGRAVKQCLISALKSKRCPWHGRAISLLIALLPAIQSSPLAGAEVREGAHAPSCFKITGQSEYLVTDANAELHSVDRNTFTFIRNAGAWRMVLSHPGLGPDTESELADDGTYVYIISRSDKSSWIPLGRNAVRTEYIDTGTIMNTLTAKPRHHARGLWLLFAGSHLTNLSQRVVGEVLDVVSSDKLIPFTYDREDDQHKNAFGPSMLNVYVGSDTIQDQRIQVARLNVLEARQDDNSAVPSRAELQAFDVLKRNGDGSFRLLWLYRITVTGIERINGSLPVRPELRDATRMFDMRRGDTIEYVSDSWKNSAEAQKLLKDGAVRIVQKLPRKSADLPNRRIAVFAILISVSLALFFTAKKIAGVSDKEKTTSH